MSPADVSSAPFSRGSARYMISIWPARRVSNSKDLSADGPAIVDAARTGQAALWANGKASVKNQKPIENVGNGRHFNGQLNDAPVLKSGECCVGGGPVRWSLTIRRGAEQEHGGDRTFVEEPEGRREGRQDRRREGRQERRQEAQQEGRREGQEDGQHSLLLKHKRRVQRQQKETRP